MSSDECTSDNDDDWLEKRRMLVEELERLSIELIGKTEEEADAMCNMCYIRVLCIDGVDQEKTKDKKLNRIDVYVVNGLISEVR